MSIPAAVSHEFRPNSQNPSNRPQATEHKSSAAEPSRRTPWERSVKIPVVVDVTVVCALMRGKARRDEARGQLFNRRNLDWFAAEVCTFFANGREQFVRDRVQDHAYERLAVCKEADGHGKAGIRMSEVRRAVERVDVPAIFCGGGASRALFRDDRVLGKTRAQLRDDDR